MVPLAEAVTFGAAFAVAVGVRTSMAPPVVALRECGRAVAAERGHQQIVARRRWSLSSRRGRAPAWCRSLVRWSSPDRPRRGRRPGRRPTHRRCCTSARSGTHRRPRSEPRRSTQCCRPWRWPSPLALPPTPAIRPPPAGVATACAFRLVTGDSAAEVVDRLQRDAAARRDAGHADEARDGRRHGGGREGRRDAEQAADAAGRLRVGVALRLGAERHTAGDVHATRRC